MRNPLLVAIVVVAVTAVFVLVAVDAVVGNGRVDPELYALMGLVAGAVLGVGFARRKP